MIGHEIVVKFCQLVIHQQEVLGTLTSDVDFKSSQSHSWSLDMGSWLGVSFTSLVVDGVNERNSRVTKTNTSLVRVDPIWWYWFLFGSF